MFHIHIGYDDPAPEKSIKLVKYLDLCLGIPSVLYDHDTFRRSLYGQAGSFRLPEYGLEYRTLSSYMLNDEYLGLIYDQVIKSIQLFNINFELPDSNLIQNCINTSNKVLAKHINKLYKLCVE